MRFIHTGDWHLGRTLHGASLLEDQAWVLDRLIDLIAEEKPDAVIVAGDVYDRAVPPADAVALLDATLDRIVRGMRVPVLMIAGNHDSPDRIGFGSHLLGEAGLHVAGRLTPDAVGVTLGEGAERVRFWLVPYADPITTRAALEAPDVHSHDEALRAALATCEGDGCPQVLVTHHFVAGSITSESERPLSVGGSGAVDASAFEGFAYVALGHLHRPQRAGAEAVRYAGSLLKYSFDEASHVKCVTLVQIDGAEVRTEQRQLGALRDVRRIEGALADVLSGASTDEKREDYVEVLLQDPAMPPDALGLLREYYPNLLRLGRRLEVLADGTALESSAPAVETLPDDEVFAGFFEYVNGEGLSADEGRTLGDLLSERERTSREATA